MVNFYEPISLRVSLVEDCQLRCRYCRPAHAVLPPPGSTEPWSCWFRRIRALARAVPIGKIRLTGGEPLLYPELIPLLEACRDHDLPDLAMTTNGFLLTPQVQRLRDAGLERVNISIDALDPAIFQKMTGARPEKVIEAIDAALDAGLNVKLNAVILRGINDGDLEDLIRFGADREIPVRFLEMMPIGPAAEEFRKRYISGREMMDRLSSEGFEFEEQPYIPGETSRDFTVSLPEGRSAQCGFILPTSTPFCKGCRRLRLAAGGQLMGCLAQPDALAMEQAVVAAEENDIQPMRALVEQAFGIKSRQQRFEDQRAMIKIGG